jgi:hypothetical protein
VRQQLQAFQQHVPLITALRNPGLRDRHWEKISAAVGCTVKADAGRWTAMISSNADVHKEHRPVTLRLPLCHGHVVLVSNCFGGIMHV